MLVPLPGSASLKSRSVKLVLVTAMTRLVALSSNR